MTITAKEKELAAVGISVAAGCRPCLDHHLTAVRKAGASDDEIRSAMLDGAVVRTAAGQIMVDFALAHLGLEESEPEHPMVEGHPLKVMTAVGAAFAVNCVVSLEKYLAAAEQAGVAKEDIEAVLKLSQMIKGRAAHHVERLGDVTRSITKSEVRRS